MALFPVQLNPGWQPVAILENYSGSAVSLRQHSCRYCLVLQDSIGCRFTACFTPVQIFQWCGRNV